MGLRVILTSLNVYMYFSKPNIRADSTKSNFVLFLYFYIKRDN